MPPTADNDHITLGATGTVTLKLCGHPELNFLNGYQPASGRRSKSWTPMRCHGQFFEHHQQRCGDSFTFNPTAGTLTVIPVPEPASIVQAGMCVASILGAATLQYRRRRNALASRESASALPVPAV